MVFKEKSTPFITASLLCSPLLLHFVIFLTGLALRGANVNCPRLYDFLAAPYALGMNLLVALPIMSLTLLAIVSTSVVMAWLQKGKTQFQIVLTSIYSVVVLLCVRFAVLIWVHTT